MHASDMDRIRAWIEGRLSAEESDALRAELERDAELAAAAAEARVVWTLTSELEEPAGTSRVDARAFAERVVAEERDAAPRISRTRRVAAAAAGFLLVLAASALVRHLVDGGPRRVELAAIPLVAPRAASADEGARLATLLADWRPMGDEGVSWLLDRDDAELLSRATGRPLLVFGSYRQCPWCRGMRATTFREEELAADIERVVPFNLELDALPGAEALAFVSRGFPFFELESVREERSVAFHGNYDGPAFRAALRRGLDELEPDAPRSLLSWESAHASATLLDRGLRAEGEERFGDALDAYARLAARGDSAEFQRLADEGAARIAERAHDLLVEAHAASERDPLAAEALLRDGAARFAGTPYAADLDRVAAALERAGAFPDLVPPAP